MLAEICPSLAEVSSNLVEPPPEFGRIWPNLIELSATSVEVNPNLVAHAHVFGRKVPWGPKQPDLGLLSNPNSAKLTSTFAKTPAILAETNPYFDWNQSVSRHRQELAPNRDVRATCE